MGAAAIMGAMRLLLIRHGETTANAGRVLDTAPPGHSLTELGNEQAQSLVNRLRGEDIGVIVTSDLVRTQETAAPLAQDRGIRIEIHADGREISGGSLEDATHDAAFEEYSQTVFSWPDGDRSVRLAGGESGDEVLARFDRQVERAAKATARSGREVGVVVAHGAIMRLWTTCRAVGADASFIASHPMPNTGIVEIEPNGDGRWRLLSYDGLTVEQIADGIDDALAEQLARDERQRFGG